MRVSQKKGGAKHVGVGTAAVKWTARRISEAKGKKTLACLTAYDCLTAELVDAAEIPLILVGDSLATNVLGYPNTLPVTLEAMLHHTAAVCRAPRRALVVADMPFMSYQVSVEQALTNAGRFLKEAGADAVKIEGGALRVPLVRALTANGIPTLAHIGLTPQSLHTLGGYRVQGRPPHEARRLLQDAGALARAGAFAIVLECLPPLLAQTITRRVKVPTIGIGAGPHCDGQILVINDLLGLNVRNPKFAKSYDNLRERMSKAFRSFRRDVESGAFPDRDHCY